MKPEDAEGVIKPIETRYAGCRFRSRLEARWAVFFDSLELKWLYEPQGYEIRGGRRYLPDFYLPELALWVEVKAHFRPDDWALLLDAVEDGLPGSPDGAGRSVPWVLLLGEVPLYHTALHWMVYREQDNPTVKVRGLALRTYYFEYVGWPSDARDVEEPDELLAEHYFGSSEVGDAYQAARSARFEYGESG